MILLRKKWINVLRFLLSITFKKNDIYIIGNNKNLINTEEFYKFLEATVFLGKENDIVVSNFKVGDYKIKGNNIKDGNREITEDTK